MASLNQTSFAYALKQLWVQSRVRDLTYKDNPLFAMMKKKTDAGGESIVLSTRYADPTGRSAAFATAQANKNPSAGKKFLLTRAKDYSLASVDNETVEASKSNEMALVKAMDSEIEGAFSQLVRSAAVKQYGSGSGRIGKIGSISTSTITLTEPNDITNFEVGQKIVLSTADGGGSLRNSGATLTIDGVDRDLGTIHTSVAVTTGIAAAAADDFIFVEGDYDAAMKGVQAWIPGTAPTSTAFFGVDRTADVTRLGGIRFNGSSYTIQEALIKASLRAFREGGMVDYAFFSVEDYGNLELELGSKKNYVDVEAAGIGFQGIKVNGAKRAITVLPDMNCPKGRAFLLQMNTWTLLSVGQVPHILDFDGNKFLREAAADAWEVRTAYYAQVGCDAPGYNVNLLLPS